MRILDFTSHVGFLSASFISLKSEEQEALHTMGVWARQAIASAMSLHVKDLNKALNKTSQIRSAGTEAVDIVKRFAEETQRESDQPNQIHDVITRIERKTFAWVKDHLG